MYGGFFIRFPFLWPLANTSLAISFPLTVSLSSNSSASGAGFPFSFGRS